MIPSRLDFTCWTNSDYSEEFPFLDGDDPVDLTGYSFVMQIKTAVGVASALAALNTVASATLEGIYPVEPTNGYIQVRIDQETLYNMYGNVEPTVLVGDEIRLPYDMIATLPGGDEEIWLYGYINLRKGITNG
jgi:hypothetical protein